jgi:L-histidine N-alpha-methyltransferase
MRLRSARDQVVTIDALGLEVPFADGEELRTEISAKFRREGVTRELAAVGLEVAEWWTDPAGDFALSLSVKS